MENRICCLAGWVSAGPILWQYTANLGSPLRSNHSPWFSMSRSLSELGELTQLGCVLESKAHTRPKTDEECLPAVLVT